MPHPAMKPGPGGLGQIQFETSACRERKLQVCNGTPPAIVLLHALCAERQERSCVLQLRAIRERRDQREVASVGTSVTSPPKAGPTPVR
jgi:hypothetical protein